MSNKTVFVPVDPEGFGCGLLLGLIIRFWREILIAGVLIFGCVFGVGLVQSISDSISSARQAKVAMTQNAIMAIQQATADAIRQEQNAIVVEKLRQLGFIEINQLLGDFGSWEAFEQINYIMFEPDYIVVDVYYNFAWGDAEYSCLKWNDNNEAGAVGADITQIEENGMTYHEGLIKFDYSILEPNVVYNFQMACHGSFPLVPIFDTYIDASAEPAATEAPVDIAPTEAPIATEAPVLNDVLSFIYPVDGQILDYEGSYLFKVTPVEGADGYLWGFFQNGVMVWENLRDEGELSGVEYGIYEGSFAHSQFTSGYVEVWVRASIYGEWTEPTVITIYLKPR